MNMTCSIRVLLVDDDFEMQRIVATILNLAGDIDLIGVGNNGREALTLCGQLCPDVLLLDVMMPVMDGIEAASLLNDQFPDIKILVLSNIHDQESVHAMLGNGADGYIGKSALFRGLAESIRAIHHGKKVFSDEAFFHLSPNSAQSAEKGFSLSDREREVLALMAAGLNMQEIAEKMSINRSTVKYHFENMCTKMGVRTRSEALIVAAKSSLI